MTTFTKAKLKKSDCKNCRVATLSILYLTVSEIIIPSLKSIEQFYHA